jgi:predicted dehydrogenase
MEHRKLRGGMVGGGFDSFIGPVHRMAMTMDGEAEFVAGVFSSKPERSRKFGESVYLDPSRVYGSVDEMIAHETSLPDGERIDFVTICTPNYAHYEAVCKFLDAGFHVICDKPVTFSLEEAYDLRDRIRKSDRFFSLTHNYTGYPMIKQARHMVREGVLGEIHKVVVEYPQGWLIGMLNNHDTSINPWRMVPEKVGKASSMGDIGTHADNLVRYVTGLEVEAMCADLSALVPSNPLEDDGDVLLRFRGGAKGVLIASQTSTGEENGFNIRVYGSKAGLYWLQENPNYLTIKDPSGFKTIYSKGNAILCEAARKAGRLPFGHPDGFIEAFANLYLESFRGIRALMAGSPLPEDLDVPGIEAGIVGMQFIETVVASGASDRKWTPWVS